jgi:hypothetical protein
MIWRICSLPSRDSLNYAARKEHIKSFRFVAFRENTIVLLIASLNGYACKLSDLPFRQPLKERDLSDRVNDHFMLSA